MSKNVFVYGTLLAQPLMKEVTDCDFQSLPASLPGFRRVSLKQRHYPAIVPDPDATVDGLLYAGLDELALQRLDYFEGEEYVKSEVEVEITGGKHLKAITYILAPAHSTLAINTPWSFSAFKQNELSQQLKAARQTMRSFKAK